MLCHLRSFQEVHIWVRSLEGEPRLVCLAWCELVFLLHCQAAALETPPVLCVSCATSSAGKSPLGEGMRKSSQGWSPAPSVGTQGPPPGSGWAPRGHSALGL